MNIFTFPQQTQKYELISGIIGLKQIISLDLINNNIGEKQQKIQFNLFGGGQTDLRMHAICRKCRNGMSWKRSSQKQLFKLTKLTPTHKHKIANQTKQQILINQLKSSQNTLNLYDKILMKQLTQKYHISSSYYYQIIRKIKKYLLSTNTQSIQYHSHKNSLASIQNQLAKLSCQYYCTSEPYYPNVMLIISQDMKLLYQKYGYMINIDIMYKYIKQSQSQIKMHQQLYKQIKQSNESNQEKQGFIVGIITTINNNNKIIVVGLFIMFKFTIQLIKMVLQHFFMKMGSTCDTIIGQNSQILKAAIEQLKTQGIFDGNYMLDFHDVTKTIKFSNRYLYELLFQAYSASSHRQCDRVIREIFNKFDDNSFEFKYALQFLQLSSECCFSKVPFGFVGLPCLTGTSQKLKQYFDQQFNHPLSYYDTIMSLLKITFIINFKQSRHQHSRSSLQFFPKTYQKELKKCQMGLCKAAYQVLIKMFSKAQVRKLIKENEVYEVYFKSSLWKKFKIADEEVKELAVISDGYQIFVVIKRKKSKQFKHERWQCQCGFSSKTFLPCSHQIKCTTDIWNQVGNFWKYVNDNRFQ